MTIAVTGAGGLIGKHLVIELAKQGHSVLAIYRTSLPVEFMDHPNIKLAKGDIRDLDFLCRVFENIEHVFHVAAFAKPWANDKSIYYQINEQGTINVCEACLKNGVNRMVYTASAGIHGPQQNGQLIDENTWPKTYHTDYEQSKFNGMQAALAFEKQGLEVNVVSPARVYAPGEATESNVPVRMLNIYLRNKVGVVPATGEGVGSYVFIDDVVKGHILAMECSEHGEEFLLGGENLTYNKFFGIITEVTGKKYPVIKVPYQLSLLIGKINLFLAKTIGVKPTITTPWVRRYLQDWGINSSKMNGLGYAPIRLEKGIKAVWTNLDH